MATGLSLVFGLVVVIASIATAGTAYSAALADSGDTLQLLSGVAMAVALIAGSIAIIVIHLYD